MDQPSEKKGFFDNVPSKFTFAFGLLIGVAAFSLFGYISLLSRVSGDGTSTAKTTNTVVTNTNGAVAGDTTGTNPDAAAANLKPVTEEDHIRGKKDAPVTIVAYTDLECPFCKSFHPTLQQALDAFPNDVRVVIRNFPLSFHANAQKEAEAAECAAEIGGNDGYWKYVDAIFERTTSNGTGFALTSLTPLAKELGMNESKFQECLDSGKYASKVTTHMNEGSAAGVSGTPSSFVLDESGAVVGTIPGALPYAQVEPIIKQALGA